MQRQATTEEILGPREACGLMGAYGVPHASEVIYNGLFALQHRGQEGAGICTSNGKQVYSAKGLGLLSEALPNVSSESLPGEIGIGHVRYSTTGASHKRQNVQPLIVECGAGIWAIAHNGNLVNAAALRRAYQEAGAIFQTSTDSEILVHIIADPMYRSRPRRVERALAELKGAYSFLLMTETGLMAARDPYGFRPLSIGRLGDGYVVASETCALNLVGATYERDVFPGELVTIDDKGFRSTTFCEPVTGSLGQCIFEHVYFARPDSHVFGQNVHQTRVNLGKTLAEQHPIDADLVIPIPDSGTPAALGFSQVSGIPMDYGFIRNHYVGRTFIMPESAERSLSVDKKLAVLPGVVRGKRLVVVDDSVIRGTTCKRRVEVLREAGAAEIHLRISCPPTKHPCFFGVDFPSEEELVAHERSPEEIAKLIGADSLGYLSLEGLTSCVDEPHDFCTGCFSGKYPVKLDEKPNKEVLEGSNMTV